MSAPNDGQGKLFAEADVSADMIAVMAMFLEAATVGEVKTFDVGGSERTALIYAAKATGAAPLVFAFHGHGGSSAQAARSFRLHEHWPEAIVVYPQGLPTSTMRDPEGKRSGWQNTMGIANDRDLAFFDAMLAGYLKSGQADPKRVYAMGHSNGGRFTYLLWAARGPALAAIGPSAASGLNLKSKFTPKSVFVVAGEKDSIVPFDSQKRTIEAIRGVLMCGAPAKARKDGYATYEPGLNDTELCTYLHPGDHAFPRSVTKLMVEFFKRHRSPD